MTPRILLLGAGGQIGFELARSLSAAGEIIPLSRREADLAEPGKLGEAIPHHKPDLIVNAAAHTQVDKAESEAALAHRINGEAVGELADIAANLDIPLIHFSTDYVFAGTQNERPYREDDPTDPQNVYGHSKLAGEKLIRVSGARHLIFRTEWVYSARRHNFLLTMMRLAREKDVLRVVDDQLGAPTWAAFPAQVVAAVLARHPLAEGAWPKPLDGIYHVTAGGQASWYEFAAWIVSALEQAFPERSWPNVEPIKSSEYPTAAKRPAYSVLDTSKLKRAFHVAIPDWKAHARTVFEEILSLPNAHRPRSQ